MIKRVEYPRGPQNAAIATLGLFLAIIGLLATLPGAHAASGQNWTVSGDTVFWNSSWGRITVWPHTATGLTYQEQYVNITWNLAANTLDFAFVFDNPITGTLYSWSNITETRQTPILNTIEQTFSCSAPNTHSYTNEVYTCVYPNGTTAWRQFYTWKAGDDLSIKANITYVNFTSSNVTFLGWKDITSQVTHQTYGGKEYYLLTNVPFAQGQTRQVRWTYTTPFNSTGKWSLMAKLSSDSIATAYSANRYLVLDPWWNTTYTYSRIINITNLDASLVLQQNYTVNLTFNHSGLVAAGKSNVSGLDVRVIYNNTTELDRRNVTAWNTSATTIIFKLQANISAGGADTTSYKIYYGNLNAANPPAAAANTYLYVPPFINVSAMWLFEKPGSNLTRLEDISGNGNNMTIINGNWTAGPYGYGLAFNGTNGRAVAPSSISLNFTQNFTLDFDLFVANLSTGCCDTIYEASEANTRGMTLYLLNNGTVEFVFWPGGNIVTDSVGKITAGRRYRILVTWDGATQRLYINGVLNASTANTATLIGQSQVIELAAQDATGPLNGTFSRATFYNRSFTGPEVAALYIGTEPTLSLLAETTQPAPPIVSIQSPINTTYAATSVWVNVTLDKDTGNVTAQLDSATNYTLTNSSGNWNYLLTGLSGGAHNIRIFANDSNGNMNSSQIIYFTENLFNFNLTIYKGWNLVTLWQNQTLLQVTNWTPSGNITVAQFWNAPNQSWVVYNWTNSTGNSSYVAGKGYAVWILSQRNDTLNFTNIPLDELGGAGGGNWTTNLSIYQGYNYLGIPGNVSLFNASNWSSNFRFVSCWNASKQEYYSYLNLLVWSGGVGNTSICPIGTGIIIYSNINETILMKRQVDVTGAQVAAFILFLAGAAWVIRWFSRSGQA